MKPFPIGGKNPGLGVDVAYKSCPAAFFVIHADGIFEVDAIPM